MRTPSPQTRRFNGKRIASQRRKAGLSQADFAERVGLSRYHVIRIEQGVSGSLKTLQMVCKTLGISLSDVFLEEAA